jgi:hypothetical protein
MTRIKGVTVIKAIKTDKKQIKLVGGDSSGPQPEFFIVL